MKTTYHVSQNLSSKERIAFAELMNSKDVVIKRAGNGGAICVQDADKYKAEILSQLSNEKFFSLLKSDLTDSFKNNFFSYF